MEEYLNKIWIENLYPAKAKLLKIAKESRPEIKANEVNDFLDAKQSYQLLKESKKLKANTGHVVAYRINEIWQIDIFDMTRYAGSNKGYKYMFACMDVFTRYGYIVPMKNKDITSTTTALKEILSKNKSGPQSSPNLIISDNDSSFMGEMFQKVLTDHDIHHSPNAIEDHNSLGIIDNFAKRIKRILTAQFLETKNKNWIDNIQEIIKTYNNSSHSSLGGFTPAEAMKDNEKLNQYLFLVNTRKSQKNINASDLSIGDKVRIRIGNRFAKGTDPRYSDTIHKVKEIYGNNILLDNDRKYIRINLLKVPDNTESTDKPNIIQVAKTKQKVKRFLKSNDHTDKILPSQLRKKSLPREAKNK
jgi:transposase InsO family protein